MKRTSLVPWGCERRSSFFNFGGRGFILRVLYTLCMKKKDENYYIGVGMAIGIAIGVALDARKK